MTPAVRARHRGGFTLVELLAVIIVIGLIAGVIAVDFRAIVPRARLYAAGRDIAATISGARSDAISRNSEFRIVYDLDEEMYYISSPFRPGGGLALLEEERMILKRTWLPDDVFFSHLVVDGVEYDEGQVFVRFDALGRASDHTVTLGQSGLGRIPAIYSIEVLPLTGLVRFHYEDFRREPVTEDEFR
jgi:prepilin-type N-terminal cleavage/methylation domain-containing protein